MYVTLLEIFLGYNLKRQIEPLKLCFIQFPMVFQNHFVKKLRKLDLIVTFFQM